MASSSHVLLFPFEHKDVLGAIHELNVRSKTHSRLRTFLASSSAVVNKQILAAAGPECESTGTFEDIVELAERYDSQQSHNTVAGMVLMTIIQIGQLFM